ncbi:MAG: ATP-binding protein [Beutenbergiaceae bacterium]
MDYISRVADTELKAALERAGAVLIEGPRACGKTATSSRLARSVVRLDTDPAAAVQIEVDPSLVLEGQAPRLLDEWHIYPVLWNAVRREVDDSTERGRFILTGSTAPSSSAIRHSGAGSFARLRMRTMTMWESGDSSGQVSLESLMGGEAPRVAAGTADLNSVLGRIERGGWPGLVGLSSRAVVESLQDYADIVATVDVDSAGKVRDPVRVRRLMSALARNVATEAKIATLARDETSLSRDAVREYLDALSRIFVLEDQPAWSAHLRSSATLRREPKRHFCDPSLALALVGGDAAALKRDLGYAGQLFESLVVHDLRVFSQSLGGSVFHARDSVGREVDAIIQLRDGSWGGFQVKLGASKETVDAAAHSLLTFARNVDDSSQPVLTVITATGASYRRQDGVNVVAISSLGP